MSEFPRCFSGLGQFAGGDGFAFFGAELCAEGSWGSYSVFDPVWFWHVALLVVGVCFVSRLEGSVKCVRSVNIGLGGRKLRGGDVIG